MLSRRAILTVLCGVLVIGRPLQAHPTLADVHFGQKDWYDPYGRLYAPDSVVGYLSFAYTPDPRRTFFLNVSAMLPGGEPAWVVRNVPLFPSRSPRQRLGVDVDLARLGIVSGTPVSTIYLAFSLTDGIRTAPPSTYPVLSLTDGIRTAPPPTTFTAYPVETLVQADWNVVPISAEAFTDPGSPEGSLLVGAPINIPEERPEDRDIRPLQTDLLQCFPAAMARSLDWLNRTRNLGVDKSLADLYRDLVGRNQNLPNGLDGPTEQIRRKNTYANATFGNRVVTKVYDVSGRLGQMPGIEVKTSRDEELEAWLARESRTEDIELGTFRTSPGGTFLGMHIVTLTGVYKTKEGRLMIRYRDDETQGNPRTGDREVKEGRLWFQQDKWRFVLFRTEVLVLIAESVRQ